MIEVALGIAFFTAIMTVLVVLILAAHAWLLPAHGVEIRVNGAKILRSPVGLKLAAALERAGLHLPSACGGKGTCGQCRITVLEGAGPPLPVETLGLSHREAAAGERLACQFKVRRNLDIRVPNEVLGARRWTCRVRASRCVGTLMKELVLDLPPGESIDFRAGAFVQVDCPPYRTRFRDFEIDPAVRAEWDRLDLWRFEAGADEPTSRAYSLANCPAEAGVAMLIVRLALPPLDAPAATPPGVVSSYLYALRPGDVVAVSGPFGHFFIPDGEAEMVFVGGGAGMAPLRSQILDQLERLQARRRISFWYGARSRCELLYTELFDRLAAQHDNFRWVAALSEPKPGDRWGGEVGFIHRVLYERYLARHPAPEDCEFQLCGPPLMLKATRTLLDDLGVEPENVRFDDFGT